MARLCADLAIPHETVPVSVDPGNMQSQAREARYAALCRSFGSRRATVFGTAHHADDQAETVLMRLSRGSGLSGLAGIRARRVTIAEEPLGEYLVVRPLLHWRRSELTEIVSAAGIDPVRDPSNEDTRFDRVQMRRLMADMPWLDPLAVARSAEYLQDAEEAVSNAATDAVRRYVFWEGEVAFLHWGHARLIEIEMVRAILRELGGDAPLSAVAQMVEQLRTERHATLAGIMARRTMHRKDPLTEVDVWRFEREPPRRT